MQNNYEKYLLYNFTELHFKDTNHLFNKMLKK
jgi:hypothetical protein